MQSVLSQTYASIEILVIDDCGGDGSLAVVESLQKSHRRGVDIRIIRNGENEGVGHTRNRIIDEARGRYLYFLDSDDLIEPDTIELLMGEAKHHAADIVYGSYEQVDNVSHTATKTFTYPELRLTGHDALATYAFRNYGTFQVSVCNCLIRLDFLRRSKVRFIDAMFWEDMAFTYDLVMHVERAVLLPRITYHYLCRPYSLSNYQDREKLNKEEILKNASTLDYLKWKTHHIKRKPYIAYFCYNLQMNSFYIVCHVLKYRRRIVPAITNFELRHIMRHPMSLMQILHFPDKRLQSVLLWAIPKLPVPLFIVIVRLLGKMKHVI